MIQIHARSCCNGLICNPSLKEVLLEDIALLSEALLGAIGEDYTDSVNLHAHYMVREIDA